MNFVASFMKMFSLDISPKRSPIFQTMMEMHKRSGEAVEMSQWNHF